MLAAPPHTHATVDEYSFVVEGEIGVLMGEETFKAAASPPDASMRPSSDTNSATTIRAAISRSPLLQVVAYRLLLTPEHLHSPGRRRRGTLRPLQPRPSPCPRAP